MSDQSREARLLELIAKWREKANEKLNPGGGRFKHSERTIATLRSCADELEALARFGEECALLALEQERCECCGCPGEIGAELHRTADDVWLCDECGRDAFRKSPATHRWPGAVVGDLEE